jgi:hypothetical protein
MPGLSELLPIYRNEVAKRLKSKGRYITINIELTDEFLRVCEERIIAGSKKYGDDWKHKDCIKEVVFEEYDIFNYQILDKCQKIFKK